ncbi:LeuD/DmdB family oxidoreductase small subunit [Pyrofollis japonicus]|uniref:LeuD/DmdB family oxidoreductase small subunit n=1 Tax=Pyrofollis japonicus TaxID=3060460 RepID=UPI0037C94BDE
MIRGRAWVLGDNISTDHIISGKYKYSKMGRLEDMVQYVFADVIPGFYEKVRPGDVIVAGRGFGYGSSREHAARLLKLVGIGAVIAKSFHRIFYRNAINSGLPVIIANEIPRVTEEGDIIEVYLEEGLVINKTKNVAEHVSPIPEPLLSILKSGGLIEYIKKFGRLPW